jgi:hypothetical protein
VARSHSSIAWADTAPYNFVRDPEEAPVLHFRVRSGVFFRYAPSGEVNDPKSIAFDTYKGNRDVVDRIVFHPDGTLESPQDPGSKPPMRPGVTRRLVRLHQLQSGRLLPRHLSLGSRDGRP